MSPLAEIHVYRVDYSAGTGDPNYIGWTYSLLVNGQTDMVSYGRQSDFDSIKARADALAALITGCVVLVREGTETQEGWVAS